MEAYVVDWLNLLTRWLHLIAGIAWIGASFYFVMLDNSLSRPKKKEDAARGVSGELWAVHGGGFYCSQKYLTGPKGEPPAGGVKMPFTVRRSVLPVGLTMVCHHVSVGVLPRAAFSGPTSPGAMYGMRSTSERSK